MSQEKFVRPIFLSCSSSSSAEESPASISIAPVLRKNKNREQRATGKCTSLWAM